jgi:hypothetical protein
MAVGRRAVPRPELRLTGVEPNGPVPGRPFGPLYTEVWFGTWVLPARRGQMCNGLI